MSECACAFGLVIYTCSQAFVEELFEMGMIDENEKDGLTWPIERQMW